MIRTSIIVVASLATALNSAARADAINSPDYFDGLDSVTIDFETAPGSADIIPHLTQVTNLFNILGVNLSSETTPGSGSFDGPMRILQPISGGGFPTSGQRYAAGDIFSGFECSKYRLEFVLPVSAVAMYVIDNDFTDVVMTAYDANGNVIEALQIPMVEEGGFGYHGIAAPNISAITIDETSGGLLDSTYIDDLTFTTGACSDDVVDVNDLLLMLSQWGPCPPGTFMDLNNDEEVNVDDLLELLAAWGDCL